jgi:hypothetical protein
MEADDNDYSDLEPDEVVCLKSRAICTSECCCKSKPRGQEGVVKNVKMTVDYCPDCGHALFWEKYAA